MRTWKLIRNGAMATALAVSAQTLGSLVASPSADAFHGTVAATTRVHVRSEPSTKSRSLTVLSPGQQVSAHGTHNGWTKVTWQGRTAYVYAKYLSGATTEAQVSTGSAGTARTTANLNVRVGPSSGHRIVAVIRKGTAVRLTGSVSGGYSQITFRGEHRWVSTSYLTQETALTPPPPAVAGKLQATENLHARSGAGVQHRSHGIMPRGTIVDATGETSNGFSQVIWRGQTLWAASKYLRSVASETTTPPTPELPATTRRWATTDLNIWLASTGDRFSGELPKGSELAVTGKIANGRAEIVHNGALRWVTARFTTATDPSVSAGVGSSTGSWDLDSPPIKGGPRGAELNRGYSKGMERTNPYIQRIGADVFHRFPEIKTLYGWRRDVTPDHPAGRAVDVMIPNYRNNKELGWAIANYYRKHHKELNIKYIIWDQQIWSVQRDAEGWRRMKSRGGDTANHLDHVHINSN
ncbi:SH3 domain-containing protein [Tessaracoccus sp. OH4464_COT-324]|uniref:SH3 domain-containing protein n=1 Tax=Tessaracoccus sp. OH4464_COT-324 TaxID=2491059 RepID=UPI000F636F28|nr:SH3 domain-containing protein [Tessaracoccus sp. OH4464_COT-324]RRD46952.1 SH3 domain-containing protein [Tessaracoccus sp. OH4464_COT-324]